MEVKGGVLVLVVVFSVGGGGGGWFSVGGGLFSCSLAPGKVDLVVICSEEAHQQLRFLRAGASGLFLS